MNKNQNLQGKQICKTELRSILEKHKKWYDSRGKDSREGEFGGALQRANLKKMNLSGAVLCGLRAGGFALSIYMILNCLL